MCNVRGSTLNCMDGLDTSPSTDNGARLIVFIALQESKHKLVGRGRFWMAWFPSGRDDNAAVTPKHARAAL